MKLRIQADSLRMRLTRPEVEQLRDRGAVECAIHFPGRILTYSVARAAGESKLNAQYSGDAIRVNLPAAAVEAWAGSDQVTLQASLDGGLQVLVEKDFQCLHKNERDPEAYPNPAATADQPAR